MDTLHALHSLHRFGLLPLRRRLLLWHDYTGRSLRALWGLLLRLGLHRLPLRIHRDVRRVVLGMRYRLLLLGLLHPHIVGLRDRTRIIDSTMFIGN